MLFLMRKLGVFYLIIKFWVLDDEFGEKTVSILLDDEESELVFIDHPSVEMSVSKNVSTKLYFMSLLWVWRHFHL